MRKISIVGVEGSGKTVLLSAIGDKYESPDVSGVFMAPENARAFGFVKLHMEAMRNGQWPAATTTNSNLDWTIYQKIDKQKTEICNLSLLDFAGELYRLSFGEHTEEEIGTWANEMAVLKDHIAESDLLIVIINLSDIINASPADPRARETMWLSKSVIDYATRNGRNKDVAIVLSQADIYKNEINACGGNVGVVQKYLPHIGHLYDDLPIFAVSAINKTVPDDNGIAVPAKGFESEGIDELMEWIIGRTPGFGSVAELMTETRLAPLKLWEKAQNLHEEYSISTNLNVYERLKIVENLVATLQELRIANTKSPKNAKEGEAVTKLEENAVEFYKYETMVKEIIRHVTYCDYNVALKILEQYAADSEKIAKSSEQLKNEIQQEFNRKSIEHQRMVKKRSITIVVSLIIIALIAFGIFIGLKLTEQKRYENMIAQKAQAGYVIYKENGKKYAVWESGRKHSTCKYLITSKTDGVWESTLPGYVWDGANDVKWQSGLVHPNNAKLISATNQETWESIEEGYVWTNGDKIEWKSGIVAKKHPHWTSGKEKDTWIIDEGYTKADANAKDLSSVIWNPGAISRDGQRKANTQEGTWLHKTNCDSCGASGNVSSTGDCWNCNGNGKIEETENCSKCGGDQKYSEQTTCSKCGGNRKISVACTNYYNNSYCGEVGANGVISTYHGFVCDGCNGWGNIFGVQCSRCNGYGYLTCGACNETGYVTQDCNECDWNGKVWVNRTCYSCNYGQVKTRRDCSYCTKGKRTTYGKCKSCAGEGYIWK